MCIITAPVFSHLFSVNCYRCWAGKCQDFTDFRAERAQGWQGGKRRTRPCWNMVCLMGSPIAGWFIRRIWAQASRANPVLVSETKRMSHVVWEDPGRLWCFGNERMFAIQAKKQPVDHCWWSVSSVWKVCISIHPNRSRRIRHWNFQHGHAWNPSWL